MAVTPRVAPVWRTAFRSPPTAPAVPSGAALMIAPTSAGSAKETPNPQSSRPGSSQRRPVPGSAARPGLRVDDLRGERLLVNVPACSFWMAADQILGPGLERVRLGLPTPDLSLRLVWRADREILPGLRDVLYAASA